MRLDTKSKVITVKAINTGPDCEAIIEEECRPIPAKVLMKRTYHASPSPGHLKSSHENHLRVVLFLVA